MPSEMLSFSRTASLREGDCLGIKVPLFISISLI
jgi:hypothetical protein